MMLVGRNLGLVYPDASGEVRAVDGVTLEMQEGEFVGILGPSGSGKSSLLYLLAGLKTPSRGEVAFDGRSLASLEPESLARLRRRHFGFVFQNHFLINHLTSLENVQVGGEGASGALLERLGVSHCSHKFPWQLSAGERQRVSIARAVVHGPRVVFADEPTAALDRPNAQIVVDCLRRATEGGALLMVTHDETMLRGATRVLRMTAGRLLDLPEAGPPVPGP